MKFSKKINKNMKFIKTFELYDPDFDYIIYMDNDTDDWISVDEYEREKLFQLINGEIDEIKIKGNKIYTGRIHDKRKKEKIVSFTTEEGIEDYISAKNILKKLT